MFASPAVARSALRRQVLYWGGRERSLLPSDLPGADRERKKRPLFSQRRSCRRSGLSSLSALPAGELPRHTGLAGNVQYSFASVAFDRRKRFGGWRGGNPRGTFRSRVAASSPVVSASPGSNPDCRCPDPPPAFCKKADRRDQSSDEPSRARVRVRLRTTLQCRHSRDLSSNPDRNQAPGATDIGPADIGSTGCGPANKCPTGKSILLSPSLSSTLSLGGHVSVSCSTRHSRSRGRRGGQLSTHHFFERP